MLQALQFFHSCNQVEEEEIVMNKKSTMKSLHRLKRVYKRKFAKLRHQRRNKLIKNFHENIPFDRSSVLGNTSHSYLCDSDCDFDESDYESLDCDSQSTKSEECFEKFLNYQSERVVLNKQPDNEFVVFCLSAFHLLGRKKYQNLAKTFMWIPVDTLMKIFSDIKFRTGLNRKLNYLVHLKVELANESDKLCTLSIDELMLKRHLDYDEEEDMIIGFEDNGTERTPRIARFVTYFSIRGLFSDWKIPVAYYFTSQPNTAEDLKVKLLEVLNDLEKYEIKVQAVIGKLRANIYDLSHLLCITSSSQTFSTATKSVFFFFDTPTLMNATRNNLMKYEICFNNHRTSWKHVESFQTESEKNQDFFGSQIRDFHVHPDKHQITIPQFAIGLLSDTIAETMQEYIDQGTLPKATKGTVEFILFFAKLFKFMNSKQIKSFDDYCEAFSGSKRQTKYLYECYRFLDQLRVFKGTENITNEVKFITAWKNNILAIINMTLHIQQSQMLLDQYPRSILMNRISCGTPLCCENPYDSNPTANQFVAYFKYNFMVNYMKHTMTKKLQVIEIIDRLSVKIPESALLTASEENEEDSASAYLQAQVH